jgi:uncharacterized protein (TIGR02594 family)
MKTDEITFDTSKAPWMEIAEAELGKGVRQLAADDAFLRELRLELLVEEINRDFGKDLPLLRGGGKAGYSLNVGAGPNLAQKVVGELEARKLREANPEIEKYLKTVKTDPRNDPKKRSYDIAPAYESGGQGHITAWCAAFVNWCLAQAGAPHLGYATARSWLDFGTPIPHPVRGCLTIVTPSKSTSSTTGHVAFFVEQKGSRVSMLGGNQGGDAHKVSKTSFPKSSVLGYRWPTTVNYYLLADGARQLA